MKKFRNYATRTLAKLHNRPVSEEIDVNDIKKFAEESLKRCDKLDYRDLIVQDILPFIDYINSDKALMAYDALWSLSICNEFHMKVIEKFSHNIWSEKPIYTYLVDYGIIERLEEIIKTHLVGKTGETSDDRMERLQMMKAFPYT